MLKRIAGSIRQQDWFAVGIEILVVMIGLLLAFQLDRWRDSIAERQREQTYVDRLSADVAADVPAIEYAVELQTMRLDFIELLMSVARNPMVATEQPITFLGAVSQAAYTYTPVLTSHTFENLRSTGDLRLILDETVKDEMFEYYGYDEAQRQYRPLQFSTEFRHFELAASVLSHEQEVLLQDNWLFFRPDDFDEIQQTLTDLPQVIAAAERLQQRSDLVAWLPYVRSMQLEQIVVHGTRLERAQNVLRKLNEYSQEIRDRR